MPAKDSGKPPLSDAQQAVLRAWMEQGAPYEPHWAFVPPARPPVPAVADGAWPQNDVDRFLLARLESAGIKPSPDADRAALLRRVFLDLTGLPPTPGAGRLPRRPRPAARALGRQAGSEDYPRATPSVWPCRGWTPRATATPAAPHRRGPLAVALARLGAGRLPRRPAASTVTDRSPATHRTRAGAEGGQRLPPQPRHQRRGRRDLQSTWRNTPRSYRGTGSVFLRSRWLRAATTTARPLTQQDYSMFAFLTDRRAGRVQPESDPQRAELHARSLDEQSASLPSCTAAGGRAPSWPGPRPRRRATPFSPTCRGSWAALERPAPVTRAPRRSRRNRTARCWPRRQPGAGRARAAAEHDGTDLRPLRSRRCAIRRRSARRARARQQRGAPASRWRPRRSRRRRPSSLCRSSGLGRPRAGGWRLRHHRRAATGDATGQLDATAATKTARRFSWRTRLRLPRRHAAARHAEYHSHATHTLGRGVAGPR
jgi:hypothetical protein